MCLIPGLFMLGSMTSEFHLGQPCMIQEVVMPPETHLDCGPSNVRLYRGLV